MATTAESVTDWTHTPPSEPGHYRARARVALCEPGAPFVVELGADGLWHFWGSSCPPGAVIGYEFWPERIEPPATQIYRYSADTPSVLGGVKGRVETPKA